MKIMKKLAAVLLALFLVCPCFANVAFAADGVAFFTDLETKVGDEFTITGTVVAKSSVVGDVKIEMTYDKEYMRFVSGDSGVVDNSGTITYTGSGDGSSDRIEFDMTFQALQEGDTQMDQTVAEVTTYYGDTVNCTMGYSAITIGEGDPSKIQQDDSDDSADENSSQSATVAGDVEYTISEVFSEAEIPVGFVAADVTYNGGTYKGISQQIAGVDAVFATDPDGVGKFFFINETTNELYPLEEFVISETYSIFILDGSEEVKMPEKYEKASVEINGTDFPVWVEPDRDGFYIFYAMNSEGTKSLYLYDSVEQTYQRMETPKTAESEEHEVTGIDKVLAVVEEYLIWFVVGAGCALIVLIILCIVLAVKLKHRNLELDDLYDEYGIDLEDKEPEEDEGNKPVDDKDYFEVDDDFFDDEEYEYEDDDEYEDEEYEDEDDEEYEYEDEEDDDFEYEYEEDNDFYETDELADLRRDFGVEPAEANHNFDSYYDDDDFEDEDYYETESKDKLRKDDTYEMNFIDLE